MCVLTKFIYLLLETQCCYQDDSSELAKVLLEVAVALDDYPFAHTSDAAIFSEYEVDGDKIIVFKKVKL